ncbi:MAG: hypothetical protein LBM93_04305 [Oscillospiraceae bacterium]|nr:hypothetical protein [Oscillospiraceae bacterium]
MYLKYADYRNVGAIENLSIEFPFRENGTPKPVVIVGENGSGKSLFLSNIVDFFYELSGKLYSNSLIQKGKEIKYYKIIDANQIQQGKNYLVSYLSAEEFNNFYGTVKFEYIYKIGMIKESIFWDKYKELIPIKDISETLNWHGSHNYKSTSPTNLKKNFQPNPFQNGVICYFPPDRYEKPD